MLLESEDLEILENSWFFSLGLHLPSLCAGAIVDIGGGMGCGNCPYTAG